jgi:hypothetical protein
MAAMTGTEISRHRRRRVARRIRQTVALRRLTRDRATHLAGPDDGPAPVRSVATTASRERARSDHDAGTATDTAVSRQRHDRPVPVRRSPTLAWASIAAAAPK